MPNLLETIQEIVKNTNNSLALTDILFGTVTSASPLKIQIEQKLELTEEFLILTKNVVDYTVNVTLNDWKTNETALSKTHGHTADLDISVSSAISPNDNNAKITNTVNGNVSITDTKIDFSHSHSISGKKSITIHNALSKGDKVSLIRQMGGQKFIVLDKVY